MAKGFNKTALTLSFKTKSFVAESLTRLFIPVKTYYDTKYIKSGIYQDPNQTGVYIKVYIGKKTKGIGAGRVNECSIDFVQAGTFEKIKPVPKKDIELYKEWIFKQPYSPNLWSLRN